MLKFNWLSAVFDKKGGVLLTAAGIAFDVSCAVTIADAAVKANRIIEAKMEEYGRALTAQEKLELTWKLFILPTALGASGAACHISSNVWHTSQNKKKEAALMTLAASTETAYVRLKEEIPEVVGKNKAAKIDERVVDKIAINNMPTSEEAIERSRKREEFGPRNVLFCNAWDGRYFWSNTEEITHVQNVLQGIQNGNSDEAVQCKEFYYELGLSDESFIGETFGWIKDFDGLVYFVWSGCTQPFLREDGTEEPVMIVRPEPKPRLLYSD